MPTLTINGKKYESLDGMRLVRAVESAGVRIGHRCGGFARCTTCRVVFRQGEPDTMTQAEYERLKAAGLRGQARLACQIVVQADMAFEVVMTAENQLHWQGDTGPTPEETVTPEARWLPIEVLERASS